MTQRELEFRIRIVLRYLADMTDDQRLQMFDAAREKYCEHCGGEEPSTYMCQCRNDD